MGFLNLFSSNKNKDREQAIIDNIRAKTEKLQKESKLWENDWSELMNYRKQASELEKNKNFQEALELYKKAYDFGYNSIYLKIHNFAHDIHRIIILYGKLKEKDKLIAFLEKIINLYPKHRDAKKWIVRLTKLKGSDINQTEIKPSDITFPKPEKPCIGDKINKFKKELPEFNFYHDLPEGMQTFEYIRLNNILPIEITKELNQLKESIKIILARAKVAENEKELKIAIETYEKLVVEKVDDKTPYKRLIIIYKKLKWTEHEIDILERAIDFFSKLKIQQEKTVLMLAKKYGKESFALNYIDTGKRIQYFGGAFDLYSPHKEIDKWKLRYNKLIKENKC